MKGAILGINGREPYLAAAATLIRESGCTIRAWRTKNTGGAYITADDWGIEVPEPRGPISFATFAHEVGHQMLHRAQRPPRWLEEIEAWEFALAQFDRFDLPGRDKASADAEKSIEYAARKALNRTKDPVSLSAKIRERLAGWPAAQTLVATWREVPLLTGDNVSYSTERRTLDAA